MSNINRRKVLKGISITSVAAIAPLSLHAAKQANRDQPLSMYINDQHGRFKNSTSNEVINTGDQALVLKTKQPIGYKESNGRYVSLYVNSPEDTITLHPGERSLIYSRAAMANTLDTKSLYNLS